jgi:hypothetical protein
MVSSGLLRRVALVRTDVSEEPGAYFIRVTKIGELGTTLAATSNRRTLRRREVSCFMVCSLKTENIDVETFSMLINYHEKCRSISMHSYVKDISLNCNGYHVQA